MWKTLKTCFVIERSNRSNLYSIFLVIALIAAFIYVASNENYKNQLVISTAEYQSASSAVSKFQVVDVNAVDNSDTLFATLTKLRQALSLKLAAMKVEDEKMLRTGLQRVIQMREKVYTAEDFHLVKDLIPAPIHNQNERVLLEKLIEKDLTYQQENLQYWQFLLILFTFIGIAWFPILSFYTSGIMIEDFSHSSLLKGYPVRFSTYVIAKSFTKLVMIISFIALIFIVSLPLIKIKGLGIADYPVVIYNGLSEAITIPQYIGICIVFMVLIGLFTLLLSIIFNMLFKNMYITLFVQMLLFFLPILFPSLISLIPYNPFNFLNFNMILEGGTLSLANPVDVTFKTGLLIISICILVLLLIVQRFLSTGKLKRA